MAPKVDLSQSAHGGEQCAGVIFSLDLFHTCLCLYPAGRLAGPYKTLDFHFVSYPVPFSFCFLSHRTSMTHPIQTNLDQDASGTMKDALTQTTPTTTLSGLSLSDIHKVVAAAQPSPPKSPDTDEARRSNRKGAEDAKIVELGEFESEQHFYPRVLNAQIHPLVQSFFTLGNERIIARYTHLNPQVNPEKLKEILSYTPKYFQWAGKPKSSARVGGRYGLG